MTPGTDGLPRPEQRPAASRWCARLLLRGASRERGFTLLEVLVALIIAALALGVLFNAVLTGLSATQTAAHYEQAIARARSRLTAAVHTSPIVPGDWRGDDGGGFTWRLHIAPVASTEVRPVNALTQRGSVTFPLTLYAVTVWVGWRDGSGAREVRLDTEQIEQGRR